MLHISIVGLDVVEELREHAVLSFAAMCLVLFGARRWLRRLRVSAEYAAALALMRAPYSLREALADCRSHIIESGDSSPGRGGAMDLLIAADAAVRDALPALLQRYKSGSFENGVGNGLQRACELNAEKSSLPAMRNRTVRMVSKRAYPRALRLAA